jgi:hypothetical protein
MSQVLAAPSRAANDDDDDDEQTCERLTFFPGPTRLREAENGGGGPEPPTEPSKAVGA